MKYEGDKYILEYIEDNGILKINKCIDDCAQRIIFPSSIDSKKVLKVYDLTILPSFLCSTVEEIVFEEGIEEIGNLVFFCDELKTIYIPSSVKKIGWFDFSNCRKIEKIQIDESNRFYSSCNGSNVIVEKQTNSLVCGIGTSKLENTNIKSIKSYAFFGAMNIDELTIPEGCLLLEENAIDRCANLKVLNLPSSLEKASNSIRNCSNLKIVNLNNNTFIKYDAVSKNFYNIQTKFTPMPLDGFTLHVEFIKDGIGESLFISYDEQIDYIGVSNDIHHKYERPECLMSRYFKADDIYKDALVDLCFQLGYAKETLGTNSESLPKSGVITFSLRCNNYVNTNFTILDENKYIKIVSILEFIMPYRLNFILNIPTVKYSVDDINLEYITVPDIYNNMFETYKAINPGKKHPNDNEKILVKSSDFSNRENLKYIRFRDESYNLEKDQLVNCKNLKMILLENSNSLDNISTNSHELVKYSNKVLDGFLLEEGDLEKM